MPELEIVFLTWVVSWLKRFRWRYLCMNLRISAKFLRTSWIVHRNLCKVLMVSTEVIHKTCSVSAMHTYSLPMPISVDFQVSKQQNFWVWSHISQSTAVPLRWNSCNKPLFCVYADFCFGVSVTERSAWATKIPGSCYQEQRELLISQFLSH